MPELLDRPDLGEEPVAADVEPPAVALDRPGDAADLAVRLEDGGGDPVLVQLEGRAQTRWTGAYHQDLATGFRGRR